MKQARKTSLVLFLLLCTIGCNDKKEVEIETLAQVYVDLLVAEDFYKNTDSLEIKRTEIFEKYTVSEVEYDSTFKIFGYDKEKWEKFFELAVSYLDTLKSEQKKSAKLKELTLRPESWHN